ncbi:MAG: hypothetical protein JWQ09_2792 [Segetibacter sp.]|jgi:hypothetical protein|nr:hypothetical protein [Segetibacter sp.]
MKNIFQISFIFLLALALLCCTKKDTDFRNFLQGHEIIYPGVPSNVSFRAGNQRTMLLWKPSADPSIKKYVVYWNNKADSLLFTPSTSSDTVKVLISNLQEYVYSFTIYSLDGAGNRSIPLEINNSRVYGKLYAGGLLNRGYKASNPYVLNSDGSVTLNFNTPDTINISTAIKFTNNAGNIVVRQLSPDSSSITLPGYKPGTPIVYNSSYIPVQKALDTFYAPVYDTFPKIYSYVQCNKSLFSEVHLPNDAGTYSSETSISKLWDGSVDPQGYPNIFHSDGNSGMPHTITFDMGAVYTNLARVEEIGRNCCNNPDQFEVWGIADINGAATTLKAYDAGWKAEAVAKGWTLLKDAIRTDNGINAMKYDLMDNPPPVRYIRIRIKHVTTGDNNYSNMSEMTFWNKQ